MQIPSVRKFSYKTVIYFLQIKEKYDFTRWMQVGAIRHCYQIFYINQWFTWNEGSQSLKTTSVISRNILWIIQIYPEHHDIYRDETKAREQQMTYAAIRPFNVVGKLGP